MNSTEQYEKRLTNMQDDIFKQVSDNLMKIYRDRSCHEQIATTVRQQFNAYVEYVHSTSEKDTVERFKMLIKNNYTSEIPTIFFTSDDGIKITKECMYESVGELSDKFNSLIENISKRNVADQGKYLIDVNKRLVKFIEFIEYLNKASKIHLIIDQPLGKVLYSSILDIIVKIDRMGENLSNDDKKYLTNSQKDIVKTLESIIPIPQEYKNKIKKSFIDNSEVQETEEKRFSI